MNYSIGHGTILKPQIENGEFRGILFDKYNYKWFLEELAKELDKIPRFFTADIFRQCVNVLKK